MNVRKILKNQELTSIQEEILKEVEYDDFGFPIINGDGIDVSKYVNVPLDHKATVDDYILVHGTNYFPEKGIISSSQKKRVMDNLGYNLGLSHQSAYFDRNTIHFAINGKVASHIGGNWEDVPLIILDSMKNHIDQIINLRPEDTFTYGSVFLSNDAIILIDESKFSELYKKYKDEIDKNKDHIVLFQGNSEKVVEKMLILLGYNPRIIGEHGFATNWYDDVLFKEFKEMADNYPEKKQIPHVSNSSSIVEKRKFFRDIGLNTIRNTDGNYSNNIIISLAELYKLYNLFCNKNLSYNSSQKQFDITNELTIADFIIHYGISIHDNEIHLLGTKEMIQFMDMDRDRKEKYLASQVQKCKLLFKKYEYLKIFEEHKNKRLTRIQERKELLQHVLGKNIDGNTGIEISFDEYFKIFIMTSKINSLGIYKVDYLNNKVYLCSDEYLHNIDKEVDKKLDEELFDCVKQYVTDHNIQDENILSVINDYDLMVHDWDNIDISLF